MASEEITYNGRQLAAARVLAKLTIGGLAKAADVAWMTISRLEAAGTIRVAPQSRHGHVSTDTWSKITVALEQHGVELVSGDRDHADGVRWLRPREMSEKK